MASRPGALLFTIAVLAVPATAAAQEPAEWSNGLRFGTFSIAAVDPETGEVGVAVTSRVACVGNIVPHVRVGVGAVATQAMTRIQYGHELLDLLEAGVDAQQALRDRLREDSEQAYRQVGVIAADGRSAQHTGRETYGWAGHRAGRNYITQGNLLVDDDVLRAVARSFEASHNSGRHLADRLIEALAAGEAEGGDARKGVQESAAVVVADPRPGRSWRPDHVTADIGICEHAQPVQELRRVYNSVTETLGYRDLQQFYGADVAQLKIILHALGYFKPEEQELRPDLTTPFYTAEVVAAVNAFREAERLSGIALGAPPGLVDEETVARLWAALERKGIAADVHRRIRDLTRR
jgi:uncharacterized Ntn-hydrolase superfamily protein